MDTSGPSEKPHSRGFRAPRWTALITCPVVVLLAHVVLPSEISRLTARHGWTEGAPSYANLSALVLVVAGFAVLVWSLALHFVRCPRMVEFKLFTPPYLLTDGPYRFTRNPMYVAAVVIWLGWAMFYGSVAVLIAMLGAFAALALLGVPTEERKLEAHFGEAYLRYKNRVPRWLGRRRP